MSEPTAPVCPQCAIPRATDGTPACSCGRLASDAHRDTRTAQAEAAEDFDPVRIRPFVKVGDDTEPVDSSADAEDAPQPGALADGDVPALPGGSSDGTPAPFDLDERPHVDGPHGGQRRRRRTALAAGAGVAAVAVLVTGGIIGGLFSYDGPSRDASAPEDVRANLPEAASGQDTSSSAAPSRTAPSASPSGTPSTSPTATATESRATPTGSGAPTKTPSNSGSTATAAPAPTQSDGDDPVLGPGDSGPEVTELQLRLRQIGFYNGDIDGDYDREVESAVRGYQLTRVVLEDESGVYGPVTRTSLESETSEP
ncbi:peptidoglycan-binding domain-containing protein [Streptomyces sp. DSM 40750]|uniref:peptidoglycan-binding domain-containing protein n=1 Tax=Streptomyces sp. DSM 40750 TaxID=2801030 RepID=UPI00214B5FB8|nr:peptidoglycan-binding protein [Streptomyces sp. DSM 40750]UUU20095.1 peptidoglycan-binding protein [Streptomyces sp. DSM 40750]